MNLLITGANGQLGQCFRTLLAGRKDINPTYIDKDDLDLTDFFATKEFFKDRDFDAVVNCAAYTAVDMAEVNREAAEKLNAGSILNLANALRDKDSKLVHISTDYVFNGQADCPYKETDITEPNTCYGVTKLAGEKILENYRPESIIIRTAWLYSPFGKNFYLTMKNKALAGEEVKVVCDQRGTPTYAMDVAQAILDILTANSWIPGVYHYTNTGETTWYDFAKAIYKYTGADPRLVKPITSDQFICKAKRPKYSVLDKSKVMTTFDIKIPDWEESLKVCAEYR